MVGNTAQFDEYCTFNIEVIGQLFMAEVRNFPGITNRTEDTRHQEITSAFASAFRFLCELELTQKGDTSREVSQIQDFVDKHLDLFTGNDLQQITFARYAMPAYIAKKLLNDPAIAEFRNFSQMLSKATIFKTNWDSELNERKAHLEAIKQGLKEATSTYNFVGLVDGFRHLVKEKLKERRVAFWSLLVLGAVMVIPPFAQVLYVLSHLDILEAKKELVLYTLPTILTVEVLLVYLFRVVLGQFRSVKAQLLQLGLRIALCQFIESYAERSGNVREKNKSAWEKFEAVVFSSLVPDGEGIPSTFDGVEQLANIVKSIRA